MIKSPRPPPLCVRRDAAEREAAEAAAAERERLRAMSEEERLAWLKANRPQVRGGESEGGRECESESESERVIMMEGGGEAGLAQGQQTTGEGEGE